MEGHTRRKTGEGREMQVEKEKKYIEWKNTKWGKQRGVGKEMQRDTQRETER